MGEFQILKLVHIVSATLLFGTGLGTAFFMWRAHRSGDAATIAQVSRSVVLADWLFTAPAVIIQPLTGLRMMALAGYSFSQYWLLLSVGLFVLAGICWLPVVWLQRRARDLSATAVRTGAPLPKVYRLYMRIWFWLGWPAFVAVLVIFWLMVVRPAGILP